MSQQHEIQARDLLTQTQSQIEQEQKKTQAMIQKWLKEASERGFEAGMSHLAMLQTQLAHAKEEIYQQLPTHLLLCAFKVARALLQLELAGRPSAIVEMAKQALASVKHASAVQIMASTKDAAILKTQIKELQKMMGLSAQITIREDETLLLGDLMIHTKSGVLDARLETQLNLITHQLLQEGKHPYGTHS